jgi:SAM-dependent methyltransferase
MASYDAAFFAGPDARVRSSARQIVPILMAALAPSSIVDVGCGIGTWLSEFRKAGIEDVAGLDGSYIDARQLHIPSDRFYAVDLNQPIKLDRRFDLAMSLEVAEHLLPARSARFIAELTALAPAVAFSAAIPFQGGVDHVNERWQDEWAHLFAQHGFRPVDLVRPKVWDDPAVLPWYAQNLLVYADDTVPLSDTSDMPLRVVHPARYVQRLHDRPALTPSQLIREADRTITGTSRYLRRRMRRGG